MPTLRTPVTVLLVFAIALAPRLVVAQTPSIHKCVDSQGRVSFQDVPCDAAMREQQVTIASTPPTAPSPEYSAPDQRNQPRQQHTRASSRQAIVYSFECRTKNGALFYRHTHCPATVDRSGLNGGRHSVAREKVSALRIPRREACRGMLSVGRDGHEFDDVPSTYDRNLGRDLCRHY